MAMNSASLVAEGNIPTARFIKIGTANHSALVAAAATDVPVGISTEAQRDAPVTGADDYVAVSGESVPHYTLGDVCRLTIGSGGCVPGSLLVSDSAGKGVIAAASGTALQVIGAIALETASEDEFALVRCVLSFRRFALV